MDLSKSCRMCAGIADPGTSLLDPKQQRLARWVEKNLQMPINTENRLPTRICIPCIDCIRTWMMFRDRCQKATRIFDNMRKSSAPIVTFPESPEVQLAIEAPPAKESYKNKPNKKTVKTRTPEVMTVSPQDDVTENSKSSPTNTNSSTMLDKWLQPRSMTSAKKSQKSTTHDVILISDSPSKNTRNTNATKVGPLSKIKLNSLSKSIAKIKNSTLRNNLSIPLKNLRVNISKLVLSRDMLNSITNMSGSNTKRTELNLPENTSSSEIDSEIENVTRKPEPKSRTLNSVPKSSKQEAPSTMRKPGPKSKTAPSLPTESKSNIETPVSRKIGPKSKTLGSVSNLFDTANAMKKAGPKSKTTSSMPVESDSDADVPMAKKPGPKSKTLSTICESPNATKKPGPKSKTTPSMPAESDSDADVPMARKPGPKSKTLSTVCESPSGTKKPGPKSKTTPPMPAESDSDADVPMARKPGPKSKTLSTVCESPSGTKKPGPKSKTTLSMPAESDNDADVPTTRKPGPKSKTLSNVSESPSATKKPGPKSKTTPSMPAESDSDAEIPRGRKPGPKSKTLSTVSESSSATKKPGRKSKTTPPMPAETDSDAEIPMARKPGPKSKTTPPMPAESETSIETPVKRKPGPKSKTMPSTLAESESNIEIPAIRKPGPKSKTLDIICSVSVDESPSAMKKPGPKSKTIISALPNIETPLRIKPGPKSKTVQNEPDITEGVKRKPGPKSKTTRTMRNSPRKVSESSSEDSDNIHDENGIEDFSEEEEKYQPPAKRLKNLKQQTAKNGQVPEFIPVEMVEPKQEINISPEDIVIKTEKDWELDSKEGILDPLSTQFHKNKSTGKTCNVALKKKRLHSTKATVQFKKQKLNKYLRVGLIDIAKDIKMEAITKSEPMSDTSDSEMSNVTSVTNSETDVTPQVPKLPQQVLDNLPSNQPYTIMPFVQGNQTYYIINPLGGPSPMFPGMNQQNQFSPMQPGMQNMMGMQQNQFSPMQPGMQNMGMQQNQFSPMQPGMQQNQFSQMQPGMQQNQFPQTYPFQNPWLSSFNSQMQNFSQNSNTPSVASTTSDENISTNKIESQVTNNTQSVGKESNTMTLVPVTSVLAQSKDVSSKDSSNKSTMENNLLNLNSPTVDNPKNGPDPVNKALLTENNPSDSPAENGEGNQQSPDPMEEALSTENNSSNSNSPTSTGKPEDGPPSLDTEEESADTEPVCSEPTKDPDTNDQLLEGEASASDDNSCSGEEENSTTDGDPLDLPSTEIMEQEISNQDTLSSEVPEKETSHQDQEGSDEDQKVSDQDQEHSDQDQGVSELDQGGSDQETFDDQKVSEQEGSGPDQATPDQDQEALDQNQMNAEEPEQAADTQEAEVVASTIVGAKEDSNSDSETVTENCGPSTEDSVPSPSPEEIMQSGDENRNELLPARKKQAILRQRKTYKKKSNKFQIQSAKFECYICKKKYKCEYNLSKHMKSIHKAKNNQLKNTSLPIHFTNTLANEDAEIICTICNVKKYLLTTLRRHLVTIHKLKGQKLKDTLSVQASKRVKKVVSVVKYFQCEICSRSFVFNMQLQDHIRSVHTKERPFKCKHCTKTFLRLTTMYNHEKIHGEPKHKCIPCNRMFSQAGGLYHHNKRHHNGGIRPYKCKICSSTFTTRHGLTEHNKIHGEAKYSCEICGQKFKQITGLGHHRKYLHNNDLRPHKCLKCEATFKTTQDLTKHKWLVHVEKENYVKCYICREKFKNKYILSSHIHGVHGDPTKVACGYCDYTTTMKQYLLQHIRKKHSNKIL